jgi:hypothetical protein
MSTYLAHPRPQLSFGDICAANYMHDAVVRRDASILRREEAPASLARKKWNIDAPVPYFVGVADETNPHYLLAHGRRCRESIVLSDDCAIATGLGRGGRQPSGRLIFAPVIPDRLESRGAFCRQALPGDQHHAQESFADLRRCFAVDAADVNASIEDGSLRVQRSLADETRDALHQRWAACAVRLGPVVAEDNVGKFVDALLDFGVDERLALDLGDGLAEFVAAIWGYESNILERAGDTAIGGYSPRERLGEMRNALATIDEQLHALRAIVTAIG